MDLTWYKMMSTSHFPILRILQKFYKVTIDYVPHTARHCQAWWIITDATRASSSNLEQAVGPADAALRLILQKELKFSYWQAICELFFAATCSPGILYTIIKLSEYNNKPARLHYLSVKRVLKYLRDTLNDGLHYWRQDIHNKLLHVTAPKIPLDTHIVELPDSNPRHPHGYVDSDWADDTKHRRSISGLCFCFAGAPIVYHSHFQPAVSKSSTEAEFIAANEAGNLSLYLRLMLNDLDIPQDSEIALYEDNTTEIAMANPQCPTCRTSHMNIKHCVRLDWVVTDQLLLLTFSSHDNPFRRINKFTWTSTICPSHIHPLRKK